MKIRVFFSLLVFPAPNTLQPLRFQSFYRFLLCVEDQLNDDVNCHCLVGRQERTKLPGETTRKKSEFSHWHCLPNIAECLYALRIILSGIGFSGFCSGCGLSEVWVCAVNVYVWKFFRCFGCGLSGSATLCCGCICSEVFPELLVYYTENGTSTTSTNQKEEEN